MRAQRFGAGGKTMSNARLWSLTAGAMAVGTGAIAVAGLLVPLATDLGISAAAAGQLMVVYAAAFALAAPAASLLLSGFCRRRVLLAGLALFSIGPLLGALAPGYGTLLMARVLAGIGGAIFVPNAMVVAAMLVPPAERGRAIAVVFGGFTLASVFGVPIGSWLGAQVGWRAAMLFTFGLSFGALGLVAWRVTGRLQAPAARLEQWLAVARDGRALALLAVTGLAMAGTYVVFTFIAPFLATQALPGGISLPAVLMLFGAAGAVGTWATGRVIDRFGAARLAMLTLAAAGIGLLLLVPVHSNPLQTLAGLMLWSAGAFALNAAQQARLVEHAPALAGALLPANASVLYIGQALGGIAGGLVLQGDAGAGLQHLPLGGLGFIAAATLLSAAALQRRASAFSVPAA
jgi:predicted MFS family arabinose efflux permease